MKTSPGWSAIFSRATRSITACTVNCIVPTNTGRPSSPCAISSPLVAVVDAVGAIERLGDHRAERAADEREVHLVADLHAGRSAGPRA